jgi:pyruvate/2-oxoacid:ferredoxin oxidoreductase alpha subunit
MREFSDGSSAIVRGALAAGCTFFAGYPITPASPILMAMMQELPKTRSPLSACVSARLCPAPGR